MCSRSINTTTTSLNRVAYFSYVTRGVVILSQKTWPLQPHINWESYVSKRLISLNKEFLSELSRIMTAKTLKNPYRWQTMRFKLCYKRKKTNILKEKPKVACSVALVLAFLSAESENRQLEDLPLADFGRLPERLLLSVRTKAINENFWNWKLRPLLFL